MIPSAENKKTHGHIHRSFPHLMKPNSIKSTPFISLSFFYSFHPSCVQYAITPFPPSFNLTLILAFLFSLSLSTISHCLGCSISFLLCRLPIHSLCSIHSLNIAHFFSISRNCYPPLLIILPLPFPTTEFPNTAPEIGWFNRK